MFFVCEDFAYTLSLEIIPRLAPGQSVDLLTYDDDTTIKEQDITRELL